MYNLPTNQLQSQSDVIFIWSTHPPETITRLNAELLTQIFLNGWWSWIWKAKKNLHSATIKSDEFPHQTNDPRICDTFYSIVVRYMCIVLRSFWSIKQFLCYNSSALDFPKDQLNMNGEPSEMHQICKPRSVGRCFFLQCKSFFFNTKCALATFRCHLLTEQTGSRSQRPQNNNKHSIGDDGTPWRRVLFSKSWCFQMDWGVFVKMNFMSGPVV